MHWSVKMRGWQSLTRRRLAKQQVLDGGRRIGRKLSLVICSSRGHHGTHANMQAICDALLCYSGCSSLAIRPHKKLLFELI